jgi:DNA-binding transcriptional regulator YiaG
MFSLIDERERKFHKQPKLTKTNITMNINELISTGAKVNLTIEAHDLREFAQTVATQTRQEIEQQIAEDRMEAYVSPKRTAEIFDVDPSTLHRWKLRGYLVPGKSIARCPRAPRCICPLKIF